MKVILISGKAQHGKDTTALLLKNRLEQDKKRVLIAHYADLLKYICSKYLGWNGEKDETGRRLLQYVGTEVVRVHNPNLWVDFLLMILRYFHENWDYVIIPDCRFKNEIFCMNDSEFDTVHIRVNRTNYKSELTAEQTKHPSEIDLDDVTADYCINNDGTIEDLKIAIEKWLEEELYGRE